MTPAERRETDRDDAEALALETDGAALLAEIDARRSAAAPPAGAPLLYPFSDSFEVGRLHSTILLKRQYEALGQNLINQMSLPESDDPDMFTRYDGGGRAKVIWCTPRSGRHAITARRGRQISQFLRHFRVVAPLRDVLLEFVHVLLVRLVWLVYVGGRGGPPHRDPSEHIIWSGPRGHVVAGVAALRLVGTAATATPGEGRPLRFSVAPVGVGNQGGRIEGDGTEETALTLRRNNTGDLLLLLVTMYSSASPFLHQAVSGSGGHCSDVLTVRAPPPPPPGPTDSAASATPDMSKCLPELAADALGLLRRCGWEVVVDAQTPARVVR